MSRIYWHHKKDFIWFWGRIGQYALIPYYKQLGRIGQYALIPYYEQLGRIGQYALIPYYKQLGRIGQYALITYSKMFWHQWTLLIKTNPYVPLSVWFGQSEQVEICRWKSNSPISYKYDYQMFSI